MTGLPKTGLLGGAVLGIAALSVVMASAAGDTDDHYSQLGKTILSKAIPSSAETSRCTVNSVAPPAGTVTCFSVPGSAPTLTVYCKNSTSSSTTPSTASAGLATVPVKVLPVFNDGYTSTGAPKPCTDNLGGTETTKVQQGINGHVWTVGAIEGTVNGGPDESVTEPDSSCVPSSTRTCDKVKVLVPQHGVIVTTSQGCQIIVAPNADYLAVGAWNENDMFNVNLTNLPVTITKLKTSCPLPAITTNTTFKAFYYWTINGQPAHLYDAG